jgi:hypothetical protein
VLFYTTRDQDQLDRINNETAQLQSEMWSVVQNDAKAGPTPPMALVVSGMNDVLNREGYTQAAWWNRIPTGGWIMTSVIAVCCCVLVGYGGHKRGTLVTVVLPFLVSTSFLFIADIDTPRSGIIRVVPQNLISLSQSLHGQ